MLAQTFKTAEELFISQEQYDTLVSVYWLLVDETIPEYLFDMSVIGGPKIRKGVACGTAGCILGWCYAVKPGVLQRDVFGKVRGPGELNSLFFHTHACNSNPSRKQAAQALHNYLTTGKSNWTSVLKG